MSSVTYCSLCDTPATWVVSWTGTGGAVSQAGCQEHRDEAFQVIPDHAGAVGLWSVEVIGYDAEDNAWPRPLWERGAEE